MSEVETLRELLREAKWYLTVAKKELTLAGTEDVLTRIEAALTPKTEPTVEWFVGDDQGREVHTTEIGPYCIRIKEVRLRATGEVKTEWWWNAVSIWEGQGEATTLEEAKLAAVQAVLGEK
jgi:hypothetical protein